MRLSFRSLRNDLRFTLVAACTLAVTIGGVTIMLTLVDSTLLKPLPYPNSDRLVIVWEKDSRFPMARGREARTADFLDWRRGNKSFESMALYRRSVEDVNPDTEPFRAEVWSITPELFRVLGAVPIIGRFPTRDDEFSSSAPTVVLSYELWQGRYHGNLN